MSKDTEQRAHRDLDDSTKKRWKPFDLIFRSMAYHDRALNRYKNSSCNLLLYFDPVAEQQLMFLLQWLLKALQRAFFGHAGGRSPLKAIPSLWYLFRRVFRHFLCTRDDGAPDKLPWHMADQDLPRDVELAKYAKTPMVYGETDELVPDVACRGAAVPNDPRSFHDINPMSVGRSQNGLAVETGLKPLNRHPPLHGSRLSSITPPPIEGSLDSSAPVCSRLSQGISNTAYNSAADTYLNSSHAYLPHARPTSVQGRLSSDSAAVVVPLPPTATERDGQNQDGVPNSTLHDAYPYIRATAPEVLGLSSQNRPRKSYNPDGPPIAPLTTSFSLHGIPSGWSVDVHPQGLRYYVHEMMFHGSANTSSTLSVSLLRVFTDADIVVSEEWRVLSGFLDNIVSYMYTKGISLPPKVDLSLGLKLSQEGITAACRLFPACQEMTSNTIEEVKDFLLYCITETTETTSTARYGFALPELQQYLTIVTGIRSSHGSYSCPGSTIYTVAWIMERRSRIRYMLFYGEPGVDRGSDMVKRSHTPLIALLSPLLFFAPDVHCTALQAVWHNGVPKTEWSAFIQKLSAEWRELIINATVLLNANIAFLAIQSIDNFSVDKGRSPAQIASYISTIVSVGSISLGLLLLQRYRHKSRVYTTLQWEFLGIWEGGLGERHGLETLAIMYSLPWALLMWAMIFFLTAFCLMCFTASSLSVRMIVGSALLVIGILVFWYLTISRERYEQQWYMQAHALLVKAWNRLPQGPFIRLLAKFNMNWTKRMPWMSFNDVEMAPAGSHTNASLVNDELTERS
ncbi:hypothetical protein ARMGADRAFT_1070616 [Armillaria gallica]|uniref:WW domain-containing protein n=1 Tax=Armillaria gallica TaxID=47427 RepID=A0A2H3ED13_ARMGA|nr:hypothetical protein ARMGADRAFT_1070616 [Armillaria gallica]